MFVSPDEVAGNPVLHGHKFKWALTRLPTGKLSFVHGPIRGGAMGQTISRMKLMFAALRTEATDAINAVIFPLVSADNEQLSPSAR